MRQDKDTDPLREIYRIADELRAISNNGLRHSLSSYETERWDKILKLSARLLAAGENAEAEPILAEYRDNLNHICPLLGAEAVVIKDNGILLIRRHDDGLWAVPGGQVDVGETLREAAVRELREETGLNGTVTRLLGIFDSVKWKSRQKSQVYHVIFQVLVEKGEPVLTNESLDFGFFHRDELPPLSPGHEMRVPFLFRLLNGEIEIPYLD